MEEREGEKEGERQEKERYRDGGKIRKNEREKYD